MFLVDIPSHALAFFAEAEKRKLPVDGDLSLHKDAWLMTHRTGDDHFRFKSFCRFAHAFVSSLFLQLSAKNVIPWPL
jgi:hypothetical protein